mmetsp:Transcript_58325/g.128111  ORF Transcript_58325/g.128111 Transcript_58325/m.128111 type:complete len:297 (+) Transcript_58325:180-1070(+)
MRLPANGLVDVVDTLESTSESSESSASAGAVVARSDMMDWTSMVTEAPDQGGFCNSCYVWASIGCLESRWALHKGWDKPKKISAQQALDCVRMEHMNTVAGVRRKMTYRGTANGCSKGEVRPVLEYAIDEGYVFEEDYLPYEIRGAKERDDSFNNNRAEQCQVDTDKIAIHPTAQEATVVNLNKANFERDAIEGLQTGPIAIGISDTSFGMLEHKQNKEVTSNGGIAVRDCSDSAVSHAVLLVGYGEIDGVPYWKLRNSWGDKRYDNGFFKIPRGQNFCGAENLGSYIKFNSNSTR